MILTLAARELRSMFLSPLAWAIIGIVQFILAFIFAISLEQFLVVHQPRLHLYNFAIGITDIVVVPIYDVAATVMMFTIPLITMRIISEEKRSTSIALLYSAPLTMTEIILGKYLGVVSFLAVMTFVYTLMPLSLLFAGALNWGLFLSSLLGTFLLACAFAAIGLFMSSLTKQPIIAAMSTFGAILLLWILSVAGNSNNGDAFNLLSYLSILDHLQAFQRGIFATSDFIYYLLVIIVFLVLSVRRLDSDRLQR